MVSTPGGEETGGQGGTPSSNRTSTRKKPVVYVESATVLTTLEKREEARVHAANAAHAAKLNLPSVQDIFVSKSGQKIPRPDPTQLAKEATRKFNQMKKVQAADHILKEFEDTEDKKKVTRGKGRKRVPQEDIPKETVDDTVVSPNKKRAPPPIIPPVGGVMVDSHVETEQEFADLKHYQSQVGCNTSYGRKQMKKAILLIYKDSVLPIETSEALKAMSLPGVNNDTRRLGALAYLKERHPVEYEQFLGKYDAWIMGNKQEKYEFLIKYRMTQNHSCVQRSKETRRYSHNKDVLTGNLKYIPDCIHPAVEGVDQKIAMIFNGIPTPLMSNLLQFYGSVNPGGYTEVFGKKANFITISKADFLLRKEFDEQKAKEKKGKKNLRGTPSPPPSTADTKDDTALQNRKVLSRAIAATAEEEITMMTKGVNARAPLRTVQRQTVQQEGPGINDIAPVRLFTPRDINAERREMAFKELALFYKRQNLPVPNWVLSLRAMYMMDGDFVLPVGKRGDRATAAQLQQSGRTAADSSLFCELARNTNVQMGDLVAKILHRVVTQQESTVVVDSTQVEGTSCLRKNPHKDEVIDFEVDELLTQPGKVCNWHTGTIRQPVAPIHQALHVDNSHVMDWNCTMKIMGGMPCSAEEWLKCGYVVDLPLSQEGSWIRLAIPDKATQTFVMHWVYIPYGSMLIRSMSVFHSGHYGSPGNFRYHATFTVGRTKLDSSKLLYLHGLFHGERKVLFDKWKLAWDPKFPESCQAADGYESVSWKDQQAQGNAYFQSYIKPLLSNRLFKNLLWNLSPYEGLTTKKKRGKVKLTARKEPPNNNTDITETDTAIKTETSPRYGTPDEIEGTKMEISEDL